MTMDRVYMLIDRYESGYGHGWKRDGLDLSKTPHQDPEMGRAYQIGYEAGFEARNRNIESLPNVSKIIGRARRARAVRKWRNEYLNPIATKFGMTETNPVVVCVDIASEGSDDKSALCFRLKNSPTIHILVGDGQSLAAADALFKDLNSYRIACDQYAECEKDKDRLVRELDVLLNGDGAAPQASLCDIVSQVRKSGVMVVSKDWKPTAESINNLPKPVRDYIHDIEANADPAFVVRRLTLVSDENTCLREELSRRNKADGSKQKDNAALHTVLVKARYYLTVINHDQYKQHRKLVDELKEELDIAIESIEQG